MEQYFAELGTRFEQGFDPGISIACGDEEMVPPRGVFLVATLDGEPVACGGVRTTAPGTGYVKRMWVAESTRGLGLGRRMLEAIESHARTLGFTRLQLETNRTLAEAIALYRSSGYREVPPFNDEPFADRWFSKPLRGLAPPRRPR